MHAAAQGEVTITDDQPYLRRDDLRVSISTIQPLESRGLVTREPCQLWLQDERMHLTATVATAWPPPSADHWPPPSPLPYPPSV